MGWAALLLPALRVFSYVFFFGGIFGLAKIDGSQWPF